MSIWGNPVQLGGGGGGGTGVRILSGTVDPAASVGDNGQLYLKNSLVTLCLDVAYGDWVYCYNLGSTQYYFGNPTQGRKIRIFRTNDHDVYFVSSTNAAAQMSNSASGSNPWYAPSNSGFSNYDSTTGLYYWLRNDMTPSTINPDIPYYSTFASGMAAAADDTLYELVTDSFAKVSGAWQNLIGSHIEDIDLNGDTVTGGILTGTAVPDSSLGKDGMVYLRYGTGNLILATYLKTNGAWQELLNSPVGLVDSSISVGEKVITENGTYNPLDDGLDAYSKVVVNAAGDVLYGSVPPSSSLGSDGDIYICSVAFSASGMSDSGLGWAVRSDCYADTAGTFYGTLAGRTYTKSYNGPCIVCYAQTKNSTLGANPYTFPVTFSTNWEYAKRTDSYTGQPSSDASKLTVTYGGFTWYYDANYGMGATLTITDGALGVSLLERIDVPTDLSDWADVGAYILRQVAVVKSTPEVTVYKKISGAWVLCEEPTP